ncbi:MAG: TIGR02530 family flagellar biosynthesis protein [Chloroflexota bacterium]|jgi:flagellar operon protein|nr:flagellar biosynthesis protein [Chloroflexota bacterium]NCA13659.1 flagellar biosynthesis protein [Pseudomonadota bacterium]
MTDYDANVGLSRVTRTGQASSAPRPVIGRPVRTGADLGLSFDQVFQETLAVPSVPPTGMPTTLPPVPEVPSVSEVRFSAHAQQRLAQASVELGPESLAKLAAAVDKAGKRGGKESLILLDDLALVVSVKNRTVITAVGADRMNDSVFTQIDSVVIAGGKDAPTA